jgi:hypothetical protein
VAVPPALALLATAAAFALTAVPAASAKTALVPVPDPDLWATVNHCDSPARPSAMGVRVSVPPRYRGERQWVRIRVEWFNPATNAWSLLRAGGDGGWQRIGQGHRLAQGGTTFHFKPPAAGRYLIVRGVVDVQWRKRGRVTKRTRMRTMWGHADPGDRLLAKSHAACMITR